MVNTHKYISFSFFFGMGDTVPWVVSHLPMDPLFNNCKYRTDFDAPINRFH